MNATTAIIDANSALTGAIEGDAKRCGTELRTVSSTWTRWSSATFTGARHLIEVTADDTPELAEWLGSPPEDLSIQGHLIADLIVMSVSRAGGKATAKLEALTVEG